MRTDSFIRIKSLNLNRFRKFDEWALGVQISITDSDSTWKSCGWGLVWLEDVFVKFIVYLAQLFVLASVFISQFLILFLEGFDGLFGGKCKFFQLNASFAIFRIARVGDTRFRLFIIFSRWRLFFILAFTFTLAGSILLEELIQLVFNGQLLFRLVFNLSLQAVVAARVLKGRIQLIELLLFGLHKLIFLLFSNLGSLNYLRLPLGHGFNLFHQLLDDLLVFRVVTF